MTEFKSIACGIVKYMGKENEEKFLYMAEDVEDNKYFLSCNDPSFILKQKGELESKIERGDAFNSLLAESFIFLCKELLKSKEGTC